MSAIKDVARVANVSVSAVSKYLRTPQNMRQSTRDRIAAAIEQLQYVPSAAARSLRVKQTGMVSIVLPETDNPFFWALFERIHDLVIANGMLPIFHTNRTPSEQAVYEKFISSHKMDGIIYYDEHDTDGQDDRIKQLAQKFALPIVKIRPYCGVIEDDSIHINLSSGMHALCTHIVKAGYTRIAYVASTDADESSRSKYAEAVRTLAQFGLSFAPDHVMRNVGFGYQSGYMAAERLLALDPLPEVMMADYDLLAAGCIKRILRGGLSVPGDILVTGFDNTLLASMYEPGFPSVSFPLDEICRKAVDMLIHRINGEFGKEIVVFNTSLALNNN